MGDGGCNDFQTNLCHGSYYPADWDNDSFAGLNVECDNNQQPGLPLTHHDDPPEGYRQGIDSMGAPTIMSPNITLLDPSFYSASYPENHAGGSSLQGYQQGLTHAIPELVPEQQRLLCDSYGPFPESAMTSGHLPCDPERDQYTLGDHVFRDTQAVPGSILNSPSHVQQSYVAPSFEEDSAFDTASNVTPRNRLAHSAAAWSCPICFASLGRSQDRKRHIVSHLPQWLQCPDPGCPWRGDRWEVLKKHLEKHRRSVHPSGGPELDKQKSTIYDPWPLVDWITNGTTSAENARAFAMSAVEERAKELGKSRLWGDSWGRRGRRPDNSDVM